MADNRVLKLTQFFHVFRNNRDAAVLTSAGGLITLAVAFIELHLILISGGVSGTQYTEFAFTGILPPVVEIICATFMWFLPNKSGITGIITILAAFLSFAGTEGGLLVGFFIAFFGGIMSALYGMTKS